MSGSEIAFGTQSEHDVAIVGLWGVSVFSRYFVHCRTHLFIGGFAEVLWGYVHHRPSV